MGLYNSYIDFFIERIFFGFGFLALLISVISLFTKKQLPKYLDSFLRHSITVIKYAGIIGLIWFFTYLIVFYNSDPNAFDSFFNTKSGYERFAIGIYLLRFPLLFGLTQLFWIQKVKTTAFYRNSIAILLMLIAILHGRAIEHFIIIVSSYHRDYLPSSYTMFDDHFKQYTLYLIYKSCTLFITIVLLKWGISEIINRLKLKNV